MIIATILTGLYLLYDLFVNANNYFDSIPSGITSLIFFIYCIFYFYERMSDTTSLFLYASPIFWIVVALIIYFAGTFFPFIYAQSHMMEDRFVYEYDLIHGTLYIIKNIIFGFAMLMKDQSVKSSYSVNRKK